MIVVTLGTMLFPFNRAVDWLEILLEQNLITEPVLFQYGSTPVARLNHPLLTKIPSLAREEMQQAILDSSLVISHAGQGSTRLLSEMGARFVLLPRRQCYGEHVDDHQLLFAQAVTQFGVRHCIEFQELADFIKCPPAPSQRIFSQAPSLVDHLIASVTS